MMEVIVFISGEDKTRGANFSTGPYWLFSRDAMENYLSVLKDKYREIHYCPSMVLHDILLSTSFESNSTECPALKSPPLN